MPRRRKVVPSRILDADYHIIALDPLIGMLVMETDNGEEKLAINRTVAELLIERMQAFLREKP